MTVADNGAQRRHGFQDDAALAAETDGETTGERFLVAMPVSSDDPNIAIAERQCFVYGRTMREGPDIARIASLVGDPARANMLSALMDGGALTASELALEAGVGLPTASSHLSKLIDGGLLTVASQGRHRYYALAGADVAAMIEAISGVAAHAGPQRARPGRATRPCARRGSATIISPAIGRWRCSTDCWRAAS